MNWQDIRENWPALIPSMQARWPELTEEDLIAVGGDRDALVSALSEAQNRDRVEAERELADWLNGPMPADAYADPAHDEAAAQDADRYVPPGEEPLDDDRRFGDEEVPDRPIGGSLG